MRCYACDKTDWFEMPHLHRESLIQVCKNCGNICHKVNVEEEEKLKQFYRFEYRPAPNHMNLLTTAHKRLYIARFLDDFLKEKKGLICGDIGCATGYIPAWLRSIGHRATGCELTVAYRRFSEKFYGVPVAEELEPKHKYQLLTCYHVLEHMIEPDKKLAKYVSLLADDGRIMVSTPEWLDTLEEASGSPTMSFEHLFHKNHINVFTARSLKNLFAKAGLVIEKEDHEQYGQTYLLRKAGPGETLELMEPESWEAQAEKLEKSKKAIELHAAKRWQEAVEVWRKFPEAWISLAHGDAMKDPVRQRDIFKDAFEACAGNMRLMLAFATWLYMREDLEGALEAYKKVYDVKPNETVLMFMGYCYAKMRKTKEAMQAFSEAADINPQKWTEAMDQVCALSVIEPCWEERAMDQLKGALLKKELEKGVRPQLRDPVMENQPA